MHGPTPAPAQRPAPATTTKVGPLLMSLTSHFPSGTSVHRPIRCRANCLLSPNGWRFPSAPDPRPAAATVSVPPTRCPERTATAEPKCFGAYILLLLLTRLRVHTTSSSFPPPASLPVSSTLFLQPFRQRGKLRYRNPVQRASSRRDPQTPTPPRILSPSSFTFISFILHRIVSLIFACIPQRSPRACQGETNPFPPLFVSRRGAHSYFLFCLKQGPGRTQATATTKQETGGC